MQLKWKFVSCQLIWLCCKTLAKIESRNNEFESRSKTVLPVKIGDGQTSNDASYALFSYIDEDGDGLIEPEEVREFVEVVGGTNLDEEAEIANGVATAMAHLDIDHDHHLSRSDLVAYWTKLGSLLTVEEVALWVEHAVQLPSQVADVFRKHQVTGFDFPELVPARPGSLYSSDGVDASRTWNLSSLELGTTSGENQDPKFLDPLQTDLGIERENIRKRLRRAIRIRMLGIGSTPEPPSNVTWESTCPHCITLQWEQPGVGYFPVHKYLLTRQEVDKDGEKVTGVVMDGAQLYHTDMDLDPQKTYTYFLQSWNAVGHSATMIVEATTAPLPSGLANIAVGLNYVRKIHWWVETESAIDNALGIGNTIRAICTLIIVGIAYFGLGGARRYQTKSQAMLTWFWRSISSDSFDDSQSMDRYSNETNESPVQHQSSDLRLPPRIPRHRQGPYIPESDTPPIRSRGTSFSPLGIRRLDPDENQIPSPSVLQRHNRRAPVRRTDSRDSNSSVLSDQNLSGVYAQTPPPDSEKYCYFCHKKFKKLALSKEQRRHRHHCFRCEKVFCQKHGHVAHSNITPCGIPGDCICNQCLGVNHALSL